jgi:hypothetical protein
MTTFHTITAAGIATVALAGGAALAVVGPRRGR